MPLPHPMEKTIPSFFYWQLNLLQSIVNWYCRKAKNHIHRLTYKNSFIHFFIKKSRFVRNETAYIKILHFNIDTIFLRCNYTFQVQGYFSASNIFKTPLIVHLQK